jgi:hypothetical protein
VIYGPAGDLDKDRPLKKELIHVPSNDLFDCGFHRGTGRIQLVDRGRCRPARFPAVANDPADPRAAVAILFSPNGDPTRSGGRAATGSAGK